MKKLFMITTLFLSLAAQAQFSASADTNAIQIGEQITLTLEAEVPEGAQLQWTSFPDTITGLELVEAGKLDTIGTGENRKLQQKLLITSFDSGRAIIPPLGITLNGKELYSAAIPVNVGTPQLQEDVELYDIKQPIEVPFNWKRILIIAVITLVVVGAMAYGVYYWWLRSKPEYQKRKVIITPEEEAMKSIAELRKAEAWKSTEVKKYYTQVVDILRVYLERQMAVKAMESTAEELVDQIEELPLTVPAEKALKDMLLRSVMIKYAKEGATEAEKEHALNLVENFVRQTSRKEEEVKHV